ncbi:MAG: glycosyltransferase [Phycisphaerales bacterium JB063]
MRVALVHEWLQAYAGSEKVLAAFAELYPDAPIHTLVHEPAGFKGTPLEGREVHTTALQHVPGGRRFRPAFLPWMPGLIETLDVRGAEVVLSSSHCVAKGVLTRADQLHISYVHSPMRYAWDLTHAYVDSLTGVKALARPMVRRQLHKLRQWDALSALRVDDFLANSKTVAKRIAKTYRREAAVVYPPVEVDRFDATQTREGFFLLVSRMVPYKQVEAVVEAFALNGEELVVIGDGPGMARCKSLSSGKANIKLLGAAGDAVVADHMARCKAFVFAADEDFGITPVEAMASGAPVVALSRGGTGETVLEGVTGVHFDEQNARAIADAVSIFLRRAGDFDSAAIRRHAEGFSRERFLEEIRRHVAGAWERFSQ